MSDSVRPYRLQTSRILCAWGSLGKNTGVGCQALLQRIFPTQGSNPRLLGLLHWQEGFFTTCATCEGDAKFHPWGALQHTLNHQKVSALLARRNMQKRKQHFTGYHRIHFLWTWKAIFSCKVERRLCRLFTNSFWLLLDSCISQGVWNRGSGLLYKLVFPETQAKLHRIILRPSFSQRMNPSAKLLQTWFQSQVTILKSRQLETTGSSSRSPGKTG